MNRTRLLLCVLIFSLNSCNDSTTTNNPKPYHINSQITVDHLSRTYTLALPPQYYETDTTFALVIGLHGTGGSAAQFERDYGLTAKANREGFIAVYPEGVRSDGPLGIRTWNAGECCDYAMQHSIDDVKFISTLIDELIAKYKINPRRIYATGMSNGAMMVYRLACDIPHKLAAIAPVSGTLMANTCNPSRAIPIIHIHSALDTKVPAAGGIGLAGYYFHPVDSALNVFATINSCTSPQQTSKGTCQQTSWTTCQTPTSLQYYLTTDGGHAWPGGQPASPRADKPSTALIANDLIWEFFKKYSL